MLTVALLSLTIVLGAVSFLIVSRSRSSEKSQYESLEANGALKRFDIIKQESGCLYAKQAQLWGCTEWDSSKSLEDNVAASIPAFIAFVSELQKRPELDAFLLELRDPRLGSCVEGVADSVRRCLMTLGKMDPGKVNYMDVNPEHFSNWLLMFGNESFFLTTFAPCYPRSHPRHTYGVESTFLLFQPEISFARRKIPTQAAPKNIRWKIRRNFAAKGQAYTHHEPPWSPVASWFVRPIDIGHAEDMEEDLETWPEDRGYDIIKWWEDNGWKPAASSY